jgi:uncharacterized membrane protein
VSTNRLEAFSDGVIAILITIMVLNFRVPHSSSWAALRPMASLALTYVLSFVNLGIYWNNHHHLLQRTTLVTGWVMWANLHLLFWLSLFPFATGWMGENHFATNPVALYGVVLLGAASAYYLLEKTILAAEGENAVVTRALGTDFKGRLSLVLYVLALITVWFDRWIAVSLYVVVAAMWFVPDRRLEWATKL